MLPSYPGRVAAAAPGVVSSALARRTRFSTLKPAIFIVEAPSLAWEIAPPASHHSRVSIRAGPTPGNALNQLRIRPV